MVIKYSPNAAQQMDEIYSNDSIYNGRNFTQRFNNWNREFHHYVNTKTISQYNLSNRGWYKIGDLGVLEYKCTANQEGLIFNILTFHFSKLPYSQKKQQCYRVIGDAGYGYKIVQSTTDNKCAILTPQRKRLTKFAFDDIIGFHHSSNDFNIVHAIGFQGDRVFAIYTNGDIKVLHCSRSEYLNKKHRYDESHKPRKIAINESHIRTIIRETLRRLLQL